MIGSGQDLATVLLVLTFDLHALSEFVWLTRVLTEFSECYGKRHVVVIHYGINLRFVRRFVKHFFCCWLLVVLFLQPPASQEIAAAGLLLVGSRILSIGKTWAQKIPILMDGDGVY
jgi:hypothetical protein